MKAAAGLLAWTLALASLAASAVCAEPLETPEPQLRSDVPVAILWVPREDNWDWDQLARLGTDLPDLRVTIALSPKAFADAPEEVTAALPPGYELTLRLPGDPILPLIEDLQAPGLGLSPGDLPAFSRPQDVIARLSGLRSGYNNPAAGFAPAAGALTQELLPLLRPFSIAWVAVGPAQGGKTAAGPSRDSSGTVFLPFTPLRRDLSNWKPTQPAAFVLDDTVDSDLAYTASGARTLRDVAATSSGMRFVTVSDYLKEPAVAASIPAASTAAADYSFLPWTGTGYSLWVDQPIKRAAWKRLALVAKTLDQSQSTTPASRWETAQRAFVDAESGRSFLNLDSRQPAAVRDQAERELRVSLSDVYRLLNQPAPDELQKPLAEEAQGAATADSGEDWLLFRDPTAQGGLPARLPAGLDAQGAAGLWALQSLRVSWDTAAVTFAVSVASTVNPLNTPYGFSYLLFDIYVDINHRAGAGLTSLLPGRDAMTEARDAWEFAVSVSGWGAKLYRAGADGEILPLRTLKPEFDEDTRTIRVSIPTSVLHGNPKGWGYVVASMALDPNSASQDMWLPAKGAAASPLLDVLSPWQTQPQTESQRRRLEAIRLK